MNTGNVIQLEVVMSVRMALVMVIRTSTVYPTMIHTCDRPECGRTIQQPTVFRVGELEFCDRCGLTALMELATNR